MHCPCCQWRKIVRNGRKKCGKQNYLCKVCGRRFQDEYTHKGYEVSKKALALQCLYRGSDVRDSSLVSGLSKDTVLSLRKAKASQMVIEPGTHSYSQMQIDKQRG